jgi:hypothetical protein
MSEQLETRMNQKLELFDFRAISTVKYDLTNFVKKPKKRSSHTVIFQKEEILAITPHAHRFPYTHESTRQQCRLFFFTPRCCLCW